MDEKINVKPQAMGKEKKMVKNINARPHAVFCGAKTRAGNSCQNWAMANGRCRMHGGKSTGPKTAEGKERIRQSHWKDGKRSAEGMRQHKEFRELLRSAKELSRYIRERYSGGSIIPDKVNKMFDHLDELESKLRSSLKRFKHLTAADKTALGKYYQKELTRIEESVRQKISEGKISVTWGKKDPGGEEGLPSDINPDYNNKEVKKSMKFRLNGQEVIVKLRDPVKKSS